MPEIGNIDLEGTGSAVTVGGVKVTYLARFSPLESFLVQHGLAFREEIELLDADTGRFVAHAPARIIDRDDVRQSDRTIAIRREAQFTVPGRPAYRARVALRPLNLPVRDVEVSTDRASGISGSD